MKIIKNIGLTVLLSIISSTAMAQKWKDAPKVILGVRGGLTIAPTDWEGSNIKVFPAAGVAASFRIAKLPFYVETGLYYTNRFVYGRDNHSLLVPALLSYHIPLKKDMSLQPFMGPFLSYGFAGDDVGIDRGWRTGIGFNKKHFYINCGYDYSFGNGVDEDAIFVGVGYNF